MRPSSSTPRAPHAVVGTGPLGQAILRELRSRDIPAVAISRHDTVPLPVRVTGIAADVTDPIAARAALTGASVVYHAANGPYARWGETLPPIMDGLLEALTGTGTRLVYGDNLYAYGRVSGPITEATPEQASSHNERLRKRLGEQVLAAHHSGRLDAVIGRASDFVGVGVTQSVFGERVVGRAIAGRAASVIGDPDQPHTFTDVDDAARGLVALALHPEADGRVWLLPSAPATTMREMVAILSSELGHPVPLSVAPLALLRAVALFNPTLRKVLEVIHQSQSPWVVDHSAYTAAFGSDPTPHTLAIHEMVDWYRTVALRLT
jgi:nucleoside-diphosphate-sugar epimerase